MFISVLLPLPELPMIAMKSPRSIRSETARSARTLIGPSAYVRVASRNWITGGAGRAAWPSRTLRSSPEGSLGSGPARATSGRMRRTRR